MSRSPAVRGSTRRATNGRAGRRPAPMASSCLPGHRPTLTPSWTPSIAGEALAGCALKGLCQLLVVRIAHRALHAVVTVVPAALGRCEIRGQELRAVVFKTDVVGEGGEAVRLHPEIHIWIGRVGTVRQVADEEHLVFVGLGALSLGGIVDLR